MAPAVHTEGSQTESEVRRLVLCFDGTGNKFTGDGSDTNIVKIYQKLNRNTEGQFHYYQPGIGTYVAGEAHLTQRPWSPIVNYVTQTVDQALGTSFASHVVAGYKFIMRHYTPKADIYILGFSRGAYTARFLAQMLEEIGLLSRGNEEMVPFAWDTYANFEKNWTPEDSDKMIKARDFMGNFKKTFCREGVKVRFLGLFDCVSSVGSFEVPFWRRSFPRVVCPSAKHVRHAVSIDERRAKFRPALFHQGNANERNGAGHDDHDIQEVWFPGNHGDVGGGWATNKNDYPRLLSDVPLAWMINEMINLPEPERELKWIPEEIKNLNHHDPDKDDITKEIVIKAKIHDLLAFEWKSPRSWFRALGWWIIEILPIFSHMELNPITNEWSTEYTSSHGSPRDLSKPSLIHRSAHVRELAGVKYKPKNDNYISAANYTRPSSESNRPSSESSRPASESDRLLHRHTRGAR